MGLSLEFAEGEGPIIHNPVRDRAAVDRLKVMDDDGLQYVMDAISPHPNDAGRPCPVDRVCGGSVYAGELCHRRGSSRNYIHTKQMMYGEPEVWHRLMDKFARVITGYLRRQIKAGARPCSCSTVGWAACRPATMPNMSCRTCS